MTGRDPIARAAEADRHAKRNFRRAVKLAERCGVTTVLITSKGEPFRNPAHVSGYVRGCAESFPLIEIQTNGIPFQEKIDVRGEAELLDEMTTLHDLGLTLVAISVVSWDTESNRRIICDNRADYIELPKIIKILHMAGLMVRLTCTMFRSNFASPVNNPATGFAPESVEAPDMIIESVSTADDVMDMVDFAKSMDVEQLSFGPVTAPESSASADAKRWVGGHALTGWTLDDIIGEIDGKYTKLMTLPNGAVIYDVEGISVCFRDCLSNNPESDDLRQIIYYPNGRVMYDCRYKGAVLL